MRKCDCSNYSLNPPVLVCEPISEPLIPVHPPHSHGFCWYNENDGHKAWTPWPCSQLRGWDQDHPVVYNETGSTARGACAQPG